MNTPPEETIEVEAIQVFEPAPEAVYTIDDTAHLVPAPRHRIAVYYRHGLLSPTEAFGTGGGPLYFNANGMQEELRHLREVTQ
jgi:hypothetical protein